MQSTTSAEELTREEERKSSAPATNHARVRIRGKMTLYVRSKRTWTTTRSIPIVDFANALIHSGSGYSRVLIYNDILDDDQREAIRRCEALTRILGIKLVVKDLSRSSRLARFARAALGHFEGVNETPSVSFDSRAIIALEAI